jgi:anaerobic selenocysteine-containing dehydrogenase
MPYYHSEYRQVEGFRKRYRDPFFEINFQTAGELGIGDGDWCWIETQRGKCLERAKLSTGILPKAVALQHGWWYPEQSGEEPNLFGNWKSNINVTMPHQVNGKLGFGDCFKNMICKVYPGEGISE